MKKQFTYLLLERNLSLKKVLVMKSNYYKQLSPPQLCDSG